MSYLYSNITGKRVEGAYHCDQCQEVIVEDELKRKLVYHYFTHDNGSYGEMQFCGWECYELWGMKCKEINNYLGLVCQ